MLSWRFRSAVLILLIATAIWTIACDPEPSDRSAGEGLLPTPTEIHVESIESLPATATAEVGKRPSPSPTPKPYVSTEAVGYPCGPRGFGNPPMRAGTSLLDYAFAEHESHLQWTPDGRNLVFNGKFDNIRIMDAEGTEIRTIADLTPSYFLAYGMHMDVSPDGSRIVYSTCQFWPHYNYEIANIGIDGTSPKRLTDKRDLDHYPVWSPDGTRIVFFVVPGDWVSHGQLFTMPADGSEEARPLTDPDVPVSLQPPVWSPDGMRLALFINEVEDSGIISLNTFYTIRLYDPIRRLGDDQDRGCYGPACVVSQR